MKTLLDTVRLHFTAKQMLWILSDCFTYFLNVDTYRYPCRVVCVSANLFIWNCRFFKSGSKSGNCMHQYLENFVFLKSVVVGSGSERLLSTYATYFSISWSKLSGMGSSTARRIWSPESLPTEPAQSLLGTGLPQLYEPIPSELTRVDTKEHWQIYRKMKLGFSVFPLSQFEELFHNFEKFHERNISIGALRNFF